MMINSHTLLHLPVVTTTGIRVGRVVGFEFEVESQTVLRYEVRRSLLGPPLLVHRSQVVRIDAATMVVEDGAISEHGRPAFAVVKSEVEGGATPLCGER